MRVAIQQSGAFLGGGASDAQAGLLVLLLLPGCWSLVQSPALRGVLTGGGLARWSFAWLGPHFPWRILCVPAALAMGLVAWHRLCAQGWSTIVQLHVLLCGWLFLSTDDSPPPDWRGRGGVFSRLQV